MKIAFFDAKPYDIEMFNKINNAFGYSIKFYKEHLNENSVVLTKGIDVVCVFVNAIVNAEVIEQLVINGVKLIALRCAGYNNVDLSAAKDRI